MLGKRAWVAVCVVGLLVGSSQAACTDDDGTMNIQSGGMMPTCKDAVAQGGCTNAMFSATVMEACCNSCTNGCSDDPSKLVAHGQFSTCAEATAAGACSDSAVISACCSSCQEASSSCDDDDAKASTATGQKFKTCSDVVRRGACLPKVTSPDFSSLLAGPGNICCKSCKNQQDQCADFPDAVQQLTKGQGGITTCEDAMKIGGCTDERFASLMTVACCDTCKNAPRLQSCFDNDQLVNQESPGATCKIAQSSGFCDNAQHPQRSQSLQLACCRSCNPQRLAAVEAANAKVLAEESQKFSADRKQQKDGLKTELNGLFAAVQQHNIAIKNTDGALQDQGTQRHSSAGLSGLAAVAMVAAVVVAVIALVAVARRSASSNTREVGNPVTPKMAGL